MAQANLNCVEIEQAEFGENLYFVIFSLLEATSNYES